MWPTQKLKLNYHDRLDRMQSIIKSRQDNDVTDNTVVISIKYDIKLSRPIRQYVIYDEDDSRQ